MADTLLQRMRTKTMELGVYLPVGALSAARDRIADLDPGELKGLYDDLVERGQRRLDGLVNGTRRAVRREASDLERRASRTGDRLRKAEREISDRGQAAVAAIAPTVEGVAVPASAEELPIPRYDSLTAQEIVNRLEGLSQTDLARIYRYEQANQGRRTPLKAIEPKLVELPIPTYDALTVEEIVHRLPALSKEELRTLRRYEKGTKARRTVLERIDELVS